MALADVKLKVGDTLRGRGTYRDANGTPVDLDTAGIEITSSVRSADGRGTYPLVVAFMDQSERLGGFTFRGQTDEWTAGLLAWDIRYGTAPDSSSTRTYSIELKERIT